jgi:hypothetical protein
VARASAAGRQNHLHPAAPGMTYLPVWLSVSPAIGRPSPWPSSSVAHQFNPARAPAVSRFRRGMIPRFHSWSHTTSMCYPEPFRHGRLGKMTRIRKRSLPRQSPAQAVFDEISLRDQQSRTGTRPCQRIIATKGGKSARRAPRDEGQARGISRCHIHKEGLR